MAQAPGLVFVILMPVLMLALTFTLTWALYSILGGPFHPSKEPKKSSPKGKHA
ncbi:MAG: hypothetical protein ACP5OR_01760 [Candidatus Dormibacteria bacterium]